MRTADIIVANTIIIIIIISPLPAIPPYGGSSPQFSLRRWEDQCGDLDKTCNSTKLEHKEAIRCNISSEQRKICLPVFR